LSSRRFGCAAIADQFDPNALIQSRIRKIMKITLSASASLLLFAGSLFALSLQEQNKAIATRAFEEILSKGRFELAEQLYAKDFVNHGIHRNASLEEDQAALKGWHEAFPDVSITPEKLIAEGDLVTIYWVARGTNTGTGNGLPATGKKAELAGITIWRIVDGKIKEEWSAFDQLSMMQQLGLLPTDKQPTKQSDEGTPGARK
jgi:steroid delta-isomerase-like uncharacterized protein